MNTRTDTRHRAKSTGGAARGGAGTPARPRDPQPAGSGRPAAVPQRSARASLPPVSGRMAAPARTTVSSIRTAAAGRTAATARIPTAGARSSAPARPETPGRLRAARRPAPEALAGAQPGHRDAPRTAIRSLPAPRTRFILLILGLLGGSLICLLVINTTLAASSFQISDLQQRIISQSQREQALQQQVATEEAPATIEQQALRLGLRQQQFLRFLDLRTGRIVTQPATVPGVVSIPAGFTP